MSLIRSWIWYGLSVQPGLGIPLLVPVSTSEPDPAAYPKITSRTFPPGNVSVPGAKQTNKFWTQWTEDGHPQTDIAVWPMPWALKYRGTGHRYAAELMISNSEREYTYGDVWGGNFNLDGRIARVLTPFRCELALGAKEMIGETHDVVEENLFGVKMNVMEAGVVRITYPVFSGMTYVSAQYQSGTTPRILGDDRVPDIKKVGGGIWMATTQSGAQFRIYAMTTSGVMVDDTFDFDADGALNKNLDGWLRVARVFTYDDIAVLDASATCVTTGLELSLDKVNSTSTVQYTFQHATCADTSKTLHYAYPHHTKMLTEGMSGATLPALSAIPASTKGYMHGVLGGTWSMELDLSEVASLNMLPDGDVPEDNMAAVKAALAEDYQVFKSDVVSAVMTHSYYFVGKNLQKLGTICMMMSALNYPDAASITECADLMAQAFRCISNRGADTGLPACGKGPVGLVYDTLWGGLPTRLNMNANCEGADWADFGNACYNDHHYHYGYFVTAAAYMTQLKPEMKNDAAFMDFIKLLIRDTTNPSQTDSYFPQFRGFDWFDFHSWSHGLAQFVPAVAEGSGKDQESVSEDANLMYGIILLARVINDDALEGLGQTLLAANVKAIHEYFLLSTGNKNNHPDFVKNHVGGIFFQSEVRYRVWWPCPGSECIHGIQMLPLSPALQLLRTPEYAREEWTDVLGKLPADRNANKYYAWTSVILTGSFGIFDPQTAYAKALEQEQLDGGLSRSWMLYWLSVQPGLSLLQPLATTEPDAKAYPKLTSRTYPPGNTSIQGPKHTNKFWTQWTEDGNPQNDIAVWPMPWAMKWGAQGSRYAAEMIISNNERQYTYGETAGGVPNTDNRITNVITPFRNELTLGAVEDIGETHDVYQENLFGIQMAVMQGGMPKIVYPVFSGMAYISAQYLHSTTPKIGLASNIMKVKTGVWKMHSANGVHFRVYAFLMSGEVVDDTYDFDTQGSMNKPLSGWIRVARVYSDDDAVVMDASASCITTGIELELGTGGMVTYQFEHAACPDKSKSLHYAYAHHLLLLTENERPMLSRIPASTKGYMHGILGSVWNMKLDLAPAKALDYFPVGSLSEENKADVEKALALSFEPFQYGDVAQVMRASYYFTGKRLQMLSTLCLQFDQFYGINDGRTKQCLDILSNSFRCMSSRGDDTAAPACRTGPVGLVYDTLWGGLPTRLNINANCEGQDWADFGNACYNDHHYHYGYFVAAAAGLVHLRPEMKQDTDFVEMITLMLRDTTNPSKHDTYFPQFRGFDWFDFHSWSHGLMQFSPEVAAGSGKDEESVSEDANLMYGIILWGREMQDSVMESLGATLLAANTKAIHEYFLISTGNKNHHPDFAKNHVGGIFFQSEIRYKVWWDCPGSECIHGIQMLPLSPALQILRKPEFARQEWTDVLAKLPADKNANPNYAWSSVLLTGSLAIFDPRAAYDMALAHNNGALDNGLSKSWMLHWIGLQQGMNVRNVLRPFSTYGPNKTAYPYRLDRVFPPGNTSIPGPKMTNKFWTQWTEKGLAGSQNEIAVWPMPWAHMFRAQDGRYAAEMMISNSEREFTYGETVGGVPNTDNRITNVRTPFRCELALGAREVVGETHDVFKENLFGIHMNIMQDGQPRITFPVFSGMAYVSALYQGGTTPKVTGHTSAPVFQRAANGIWSVTNEFGSTFRVYALTREGDFVDESFDFGVDGSMNKELDGWIRVARVFKPADIRTLDSSARCIVTGLELEIELGGIIRYVFEHASCADSSKSLHFAYSHHAPLLSANVKPELSKIPASTKGYMHGFLGSVWEMRMDHSRVETLDFMPAGDVPAANTDVVQTALAADLEFFRNNWLTDLLGPSWYFTGKAFQKLGTICLQLEKFYGSSDSRVTECSDLLKQAFECLYSRKDSDLAACGAGPVGLVYDTAWGGLPTRLTLTVGCDGSSDSDFGNSCYNDHHYHYGYFVVAGAIMLHFKPEMKTETGFMEMLTLMMRDTTNPSKEDTYFPQFRGFDWFDFHSWSHGLAQFPAWMVAGSGKDQESVSEDVNLMYGMILWSREVSDSFSESLSKTLLSANLLAISQYFLMETGNQNHNPDFAKNHVGGIFFQSEIRYRVWWNCPGSECIHGIQMLPLTPALQLIRSAKFARQEWTDVLEKLPASQNADPNYAWVSVLITGSLGIFNPAEAYSRALTQNVVDDGLTKSWMLYWLSVQPGESTTAAELAEPAEAATPERVVTDVAEARNNIAKIAAKAATPDRSVQLSSPALVTLMSMMLVLTAVGGAALYARRSAPTGPQEAEMEEGH